MRKMKTKTKQILDVYFQTTGNYTARTEELDGKHYLVVPVTMMVEGVHSGSHGPILHLAEELGRYPESWDGIPVTIGHPQVNGDYVSANSPEVLEDWAVGRIFNTRMQEGSLKAEAWVAEEDVTRISPETLEMINNGEEIEVSVGVFSDEEEEQGTWNLENYIAIARNHRPNHLALLPDEVGACSIEDGCGIRVNKKGGTKMTEKKVVIVNSENQVQIFKELNRKGFSVNEVGHRELAEKVSSYVYGLDGNGLDNYMEEVYQNYFVYNQFNNRVEPRTKKLYKQFFELNEADELVLVGDAARVKRDVTYAEVPIVNTSGQVKTKRIIPKKVTVMAKDCVDCVKNLVDGLIANKALAWSDDDRETLMAMTEETLEKMTPPKPAEIQSNTKTKTTREELLSVLSEKPLTKEESLALLDPAVAEHIQQSINTNAEQKTQLVTAIMANTEEWEEADLQKKDLSELTKLYKLASKEEGPVVFAAGGDLGGNTKVRVDKTGPTTVMLPSNVKKS